MPSGGALRRDQEDRNEHQRQLADEFVRQVKGEQLENRRRCKKSRRHSAQKVSQAKDVPSKDQIGIYPGARA